MVRVLVALVLGMPLVAGCVLFDTTDHPVHEFQISAEIHLFGNSAEALMFPPRIDGGDVDYTFEYDGPPVASDDVIISYVDAGGVLFVRNATSFGAPANLSAGDRFVVPDVNLTSNVTVLVKNSEVGGRMLLANDLFTSEGTLTFSRVGPGAEASWSHSSSLANATDDPNLGFTGDIAATTRLSAAGAPQRHASEFGTFEALGITAVTESTWSADAELEYRTPEPEGGATRWSRERRVELGAYVTVDGRLIETRTGGRDRVDLSTTYWNATIPRDEPEERETPHPYRDETLPEERVGHAAVPLGGPGWARTLAAALARYDLRAGDSMEYVGSHNGAMLHLDADILADERGIKILSTGRLTGGDGALMTLRATSAILDGGGWFPLESVSRRSLNLTLHEFAAEVVGLIPAASPERLGALPHLVATDSTRLLDSKGMIALSPVFATLATGYPVAPPNAPGEEWQVLLAGGGDVRLCVLGPGIQCSGT